MATIRPESIERAERMVQSARQLESLSRELAENEPEAFSWLNAQARDVLLKVIQPGAYVNDQVINDLGTRILRGVLSGFILAEICRTDQFLETLGLNPDSKEMEQDTEQEYQDWLEGRAEPEYYKYDITEDDLKENEEIAEVMQAAKNAFVARCKAEQEEAQKQASLKAKQTILAKVEEKAGISETKGEGPVTRRRKIPKTQEDADDLDIEDIGS